jgi:proton-translocating NADH-quinone oxidoreductase chain N
VTSLTLAPPLVWLLGVPLVGVPLVYLTRRRWLLLVALASMWVLFILSVIANAGTPPRQAYQIGGVPVLMDGVGLLLAGVALTVGTAAAIYSLPYLAGERGRERYDALILALIGSVIGVGCAGDLFNLWLWFECLSVTAWLLVAFHQERGAALEAGIKYLVQSAVGSALVLMGIALTFWETGTLDLEGIRGAATATLGLVAAGTLYVIGFGVKAALVPLHTWLPDAHSQAPSGISALLSGIVIEAGLLALLRALAALTAVSLSWGWLLLVFGAVNLCAGNLLALRQSEVKRLLAYSSVAQLGYMLIGIGIGVTSGEVGGAQGGLFHLITHAAMKALAFLAVGAMAVGVGHSLTIADLGGASRKYPVMALGLSMAVLGLGGLPPFAGFLSKWQIFASGVATGDALITAVVVLAAANSVLSLAYYAPLANALYRREPSAGARDGAPLAPTFTVIVALLALVVVGLGLVPGLLDGLTERAGAALVAAFAR